MPPTRLEMNLPAVWNRSVTSTDVGLDNPMWFLTATATPADLPPHELTTQGCSDGVHLCDLADCSASSVCLPYCALASCTQTTSADVRLR